MNSLEVFWSVMDELVAEKPSEGVAMAILWVA